MENKKNIDWLAVESDYRPNILSLREIGNKHGCTEGAIRKRAKKEGWSRDLTAKIRAKAEDIVRREAVRSEVRSEYSKATEQEVIEANAKKHADIDSSHRWITSLLSDVNISLIQELQAQNEHKEDLEKLGEMLRNPDQYGNDKLNDIYMKAISFPGRVDCAKKITDSTKVSVELQRKVYKIDDNGTDNSFEDWLRKQRNG